MQIRVFESATALAEALAVRLVDALSGGPRCAVMLAGGRTPLDAYGRLAAHSPQAWARVFLSDERMAPPDSPDSNAFHVVPPLAAAGLPRDLFFSVRTDWPIEAAADAYDRLLAGWVTEGVRFPLGLLGLGADGHTASLFSLDEVEQARVGGRWAVAVRRPSPPDRVSVAPRLLERIERLLFVVTGAEKRAVVARWLEQPASLPAGLAVAGHPSVELWLDVSAAGPGMPR